MLTSPTPAWSPLRHAATPTIAQSCARRLNFWKFQPAPFIFGHADLGEDLVGLERRLEERAVEVDRRDLAGAVRALGHVGGTEGERGRGEIGRRVGVRDRATERATVAHLRVADVASGVSQQRHVLLEEVGRLDVHVARHRTDRDLVALLADVRQIGESSDVDQHARLRESQLHHRQQAVAAGDELGLVAVLADEADRFLGGLGADVVERCGDHRVPPGVLLLSVVD